MRCTSFYNKSAHFIQGDHYLVVATHKKFEKETVLSDSPFNDPVLIGLNASTFGLKDGDIEDIGQVQLNVVCLHAIFVFRSRLESQKEVVLTSQ